MKVTRGSTIAAGLWAVAVAVALAVTLHRLRTDAFDGLNNLLQIPLALPWFLLPTGAIWGHTVDAWVAAGMGWLNGLLVLLFGQALVQRLRGGEA